MSKDLTHIVKDWDYDPEAVMVRLVAGDDGRNKLQLRVDLGVLQMELDGRPDGFRPEGVDSWLDYHEHRQRLHDESHPDRAPYRLTDDDCLKLWREGVQYYHRYLSAWHLDMYELCARDTARNLRLFAFVRTHTDNEQNKLQFDQWRPYVTMMHTRAVATPMIERREYEEGLRIIEGGIDAIRDFLDEYQQSHRAEECVELVTLERWRDDILAREARAAAFRPQSAAAVLRKKLDAAIAAEEFEEAARLRDEIRRMKDEG